VKPIGKRACPHRQRFNDSTLQQFNINVANRQSRLVGIDLRRLRQLVQSLLRDHLQIKQADLGVYLVAAPEMTRLNETFLHHAGPTDVITFDYSDHASRLPHDSGTGVPPVRDRQAARPTLHGEIFICVDEARIQAHRYRTSWQSELVRYLIHGLLHLLGHDDRTSATRRNMKEEEERLLREMTARFPLSRLGRRPRIRA
jgi:probable rRNA maturation factor